MQKGDHWRDWEIIELLGSGSFGKVYRIRRSGFDGFTEESALKVIRIPQNDSDYQSMLKDGMDEKSANVYFETMVNELSREFTLMSSLKGNSNIVSFEDYEVNRLTDRFGWEIVIRMELLEPLNESISKYGITAEDIVRLGMDMCTALGLCHRKNIIHRDIKPQNIFITDNGNYKLGDFGIARTIEKTMGGMSRKGTYRYMAPEVFRGDEYDHTVDIYSLGIVLYTLLNENRGPFLPLPPAAVSHNDEETANDLRFRGEPLPPPCNANTMLSHIICKACAPNPADRYSNVEAMKNDLENYMINYGLEDDHTRAMEDYMFGSQAARPHTGSQNTDSYPQDTAPRNTGAYHQGGMPGYTGQLTTEEAWKQEIINTRHQNEEREREEKKKPIIIVCAIVALLLVAISVYVIGRSLGDKGHGPGETGKVEVTEGNGGDSSEAGSNGGTDVSTGTDTNSYANDLASEYIMPDADTRVYEKSEIEQFDLTLTQRAINELFARHGYIFKEDNVMQYFTENTSWYVPRYESVDPKTDFNNYEYKNYLMLVDWRAELKK